LTSFEWISPKIETLPGVRLRCCFNCSGEAKESFFFAFNFSLRALRFSVLYAFMQTRKKFLFWSFKKRFFVWKTSGILIFWFFDSSTVKTATCLCSMYSILCFSKYFFRAGSIRSANEYFI